MSGSVSLPDSQSSRHPNTLAVLQWSPRSCKSALAKIDRLQKTTNRCCKESSDIPACLCYLNAALHTRRLWPAGIAAHAKGERVLLLACEDWFHMQSNWKGCCKRQVRPNQGVGPTSALIATWQEPHGWRSINPAFKLMFACYVGLLPTSSMF